MRRRAAIGPRQQGAPAHCTHNATLPLHEIFPTDAYEDARRRYGIDTSVLVRLLTGDPAKDFEYCVGRLRALIDEDGSEIFASNQVVGEAYIAVQHHYGVSKAAARASLIDVLRSGLVSPLNGRSVIEALETSAGAGLLDRLIADDYVRGGMEVLTLDRKMAVLPDVRRL